VRAPPAAGGSAGAVLETRDLGRSFGGVRALDGMRLSLDAGELRCIIGPNGAGKSTLFRILMGAVEPDTGSIRFKGRDVTRAPTHVRARMGIGIKFQSMAVYSGLSVGHNLRLPLQHSCEEGEIGAETERLLARLRLDGAERLPAGRLSHGQKQWLAIGMALAMRPSLLLLDEPTAGMGPDETRETGELVRSVNADGVTILIVEHDMAFVRQLDAPVTVLHSGRILAEGAPAEIEDHAEVRKVYLGASSLDAVRRRGKAGMPAPGRIRG